MASVIYPKAKEAALAGGLNLSSGVVKAALIDTGTYTYSSAHEFYDEVTGVVGTPVTLANKSLTNGVFDADDVTFANVAGDTIEAILIYVDTGTAGTSRLVALIDQGAGLPLTPNGTDVQCVWDNGANRIFAL